MSTIGPELPPHLRVRSKQEEDGPSVAGPQIPTNFLKPAVEEEDEDEDDYAPSLPPDMIAARQAGPSAGPVKPVKGPSLPTSYYRDDDSDDDVGPRPLPPSAQRHHGELDGVKQFLEKEERRRQQIEVCSIHHLSLLRL